MSLNAFVILRRARITLLSFLGLISLTWSTLFAIFLSREWSQLFPSQKIVVVGFLSLHVFTAILLYLMAILLACPWRDVVRVFAILAVHIGSSVLFTHYRPSLPCRGFGTETACREFVFIIFVGCWVFSGTVLCFAIALGVVALVHQSVESLPGTEDDVPRSPECIKDDRPSDDPQTISFHSIRTKVNNTNEETIELEPPHLWQSFRTRNSRQRNVTPTNGGTISTRDGPGEGTGVGSGPQHADSFCRKFLCYSPTSRVPINSQVSMIRPGVGGEITPIVKDRPNQSSALPKLQIDVSSPNPLRNSPSLVSTGMPRDSATEYTRTVYSVLSNDSVLTSPWDDSQWEPTYPDHARTMTHNTYPFQPAAANFHTMGVRINPYALLPSVPATPGVARFQDLSASRGPRDLSSGNNASFVASGPNASLMCSITQPRRTVQRSGGVTMAHHPSMPLVKGSPPLRRGSDGQVLNQTQWWDLVRSAAAKP